MKVVFLDVDGPLIPGRMYFRRNATFCRKRALYRYCPSIVDMINYLTDCTGAKVVFNSAHNRRGAETMVAQAKFNKMRNVHEGAPVTTFPIFKGESHERVSAVKNYVKEHDIDSYVCFDDEPLKLKGFQQVDFHEGISTGHISWALQHLTGDARGLGFVPGMISCQVGLSTYKKIRNGESAPDIVSAFII